MLHTDLSNIDFIHVNIISSTDIRSCSNLGAVNPEMSLILVSTVIIITTRNLSGRIDMHTHAGRTLHDLDL